MKGLSSVEDWGPQKGSQEDKSVTILLEYVTPQHVTGKPPSVTSRGTGREGQEDLKYSRSRVTGWMDGCYVLHGTGL